MNLGSLRELIFWALFIFAPMVIVLGLAQLCLAAPARRNERARLFLDLLETALQTGQAPERALAAISETRDRTLTVHFHLLAAHLEEGCSLAQALERTPRLLPAGVSEVVQIGAAENTLPQLLPAARAMLTDAASRMRGAVNYVIVFLVVLAPAVLFFLPILSHYVWPRLKGILVEMEIAPPAYTEFVFENFLVATLLQSLLIASLLFFGFFYTAGPRVGRWTKRIFGLWPDRWLLMLPWRRRRAHRDFTGVLATLLDAGLEESRAVQLAARASANAVFERRAETVARRLREGLALPQALEAIEANREFQWRWQNALRAGTSFFAALRGWHESLESRAFQQEQAAAHAITSTIVVINGALVACLMAAVFLIIIAIIEDGILW